MEVHATHLHALLGGALIGASSMLVTAVTGRRVGVSGYASSLLGASGAPRAFAASFLLGMVACSALAAAVAPRAFVDTSGRPLLAFFIGGALIGWGARRANGCTSGHGVWGVARASARSLVAIALFAVAAMVVVAVWPAGGAS